jgi:ribosomal protein L32
MIKQFIKRLNKIGIEVELTANYPWVYLRSVNGITVTEKFQGNHGFTAFYLIDNNRFRFSNRTAVFNQIRGMVEKVNMTTRCPECQCDECSHTGLIEESHRVCAKCGQEWFTDVDYHSNT